MPMRCPDGPYWLHRLMEPPLFHRLPIAENPPMTSIQLTLLKAMTAALEFVISDT